MHKPVISIACGSSSLTSINKRLGLAIQKVGSDRFSFSELAVDALPLYNRDLDASLPPVVEEMKAQVSASDGVLFLCPEYNRSISSSLKNALDWGSRPYGQSCWNGKMAAIAGASVGAIGTAVAQSHLRIMLAHLNMLTLTQPELYVRLADELISESGEIHAKAFADLIDSFVSQFSKMFRMHTPDRT